MTAALFAARQQFLQHGYAVLPGAVERSTAESIRAGALSSTLARSRFFYHVPQVEDLLKSRSAAQQSAAFPDSVLVEMQKRKALLQHYRKLKRQRRRLTRTVRTFLNGRTREDLSPADLWKLSELLALEASKASGRGCTSTVHDDPQMLASINRYRANAWMTNEALRSVLRMDAALKSSLAAMAEMVGGVDQPVVFGDSPLLRPAFGNPVGYHCTAPMIGTRTNARPPQGRGSGSAPAVTLLVFTYAASKHCLEPYVLQNSHRFVQEQYIHRVPPQELFSFFMPHEAHIPFALQQFCFDRSVVGRSLLPVGGGDGKTAGTSGISPGTVMVVDPHIMMAFGPNLGWESEVVYRLNVVSEGALPFLAAPSWIRGWRSLPREVHFASPVVFPPLYK